MVRRIPKQWLGSMTTLQRNSIALHLLSSGDVIHNSTSNKMQFWDGTTWQDVGYGVNCLLKVTSAQRDIMIAGWGISESSIMWYNTTTLKWEGWNGTAIIIIG